MLRDWKPFDLVLVALLLPLWLVSFGLHVRGLAVDGVRASGVYFTPAPSPQGYPRVSGFYREMDQSAELRVGDRVLRVGDVDLQGMGVYQAEFAMGAGLPGSGGSSLEIERDGKQLAAKWTATAPHFPWARLPILLGLAVVAVVVLVRSPGTSESRLLFAAFMTSSIFVSTMYLGSSKFLSARSLATTSTTLTA